MFRQTPFTKAELNRTVVARVKQGKVRYFDPVTARMTGWMPDPFAEVRKVDSKKYEMRKEFMRMLKGELLNLTRDLGFTFPQRTPKRDLVDALLSA